LKSKNVGGHFQYGKNDTNGTPDDTNTTICDTKNLNQRIDPGHGLKNPVNSTCLALYFRLQSYLCGEKESPMEAIKVLIVEDEFVISQNIQSALKKTGYAITGHAFNYEEAVEALKKERPDIILLDITLDGDRDGIELADFINQHYRLPFIFLTSHADQRTIDRAKATHPSAYLVKPFDANDLYAAIEIGFANYAKTNPSPASNHQEAQDEFLINNALFIKKENLFIKVKLDDIRWLKSDRVYIEIATSKDTHQIRSNFGDLLLKINAKQFFRVHRSYVVNLNLVDAINHNTLMIGEEKIPVGRSYREQLLEKLKTAS